MSISHTDIYTIKDYLLSYLHTQPIELTEPLSWSAMHKKHPNISIVSGLSDEKEMAARTDCMICLFLPRGVMLA